MLSNFLVVPVLVIAALTTLAPAPASAASPRPAVVVTGGPPLNVREGAATDRKLLRTVANGASVTIVCRVYGEFVSGPARDTALWERLSDGGMVSGAYLRWLDDRPTLPWCGEPPVNAVTGTVSAPGGKLNVRSGPGTENALVDRIPNGHAVRVSCRVWGETVEGNSVWNSLAPGRFVASAYIKWSSAQPRYPWCGQDPPTEPAATKEGFFARVVGPARQSARDSRVPASVTVAQAILESGWGGSRLTRLDHSYFGMKCFGSPGGTAIGCSSYETQECDSGGSCYATRDLFRAYESPNQSFLDHGKQLATLPRYATAMKHTADPDRFAREIHKAGYATAPTYADSLIDLMKQYNLYQYDKHS